MPPANLAIPRVDGVAKTDTQEELLHTPVMPVTAESLALLHNLVKEDTLVLNKTSKQRLQRRVQKLASAAQISFAERDLLQDYNQFLFKVNNEAKVRRSTGSVALGKAKVMSYKDLKETRAKRAAKENAK
ncbi:uncharacterized protein BDR25DRAFT_320034 [Lindgomyces ingoldianus]|uniref:Uncharacterized protein n=1 Tax=Lindgomyces ingoldianus TaxID=673940 RepID=A0ACB6Q8R3_9PLEO|nr:uncharacterized protein BDR25DRAFT_320034 [Lindgomyces ingoldianus]KAF2463338.1 hypothetical protein BDR25DRAFT_320034 [Lindgomyces ingoldianus]